MAPVALEPLPFIRPYERLVRADEGRTQIRVRLCNHKWNVKQEAGSRQQVKRKAQAGCAPSDLAAVSAQISTRCRGELRSALSLHGSALRSSRRPHRPVGLWTCCDPAPDCSHWRRAGGSGVHGKVRPVGYFWISVRQHVNLQGCVTEALLQLQTAGETCPRKRCSTRGLSAISTTWGSSPVLFTSVLRCLLYFQSSGVEYSLLSRTSGFNPLLSIFDVVSSYFEEINNSVHFLFVFALNFS